MADSDGFKVVKNKSKRNKNKAFVALNTANSSVEGVCDQYDSKKFEQRFNSCLQDIRLSNFFLESYDIITNALNDIQKNETADGSIKPITFADQVDLLSYGLGNFSSCPIARYQLSFLVILREKLADLCHTCVVYDPVFTVHERDTLSHLGFTVLTENEEGKRMCHRPTLAFLPHCGKALYNNLVWRNLQVRVQKGSEVKGEGCCDGEGGLNNLVLVGNSFSRMIERTPKSELLKTGSYITRVAPYTQEVPLPSTFVHSDVFNDLSVHSFLCSMLNKASESLSDDLAEPLYNDTDVEFIRK